MKIVHTNGDTSDTDKMLDSDAEILEMTERLRALCFAHNRLMFLVVQTKDEGKLGGMTFYNMNGEVLNPPADTNELAALKFNSLLSMMDSSIQFLTSGRGKLSFDN